MSSFCRGALLLTPLSLAVSGALAQAVPGGTLDPLTIPKYVTPLVIPPVLYDDGGKPMDVAVALRQIEQQVLPEGFPKTPLWAYGNPSNPATFNNPAFTFEVTKDVDTTVTYTNELVDANGNYLPHIIQDADGKPLIDQTLHWAAPNQDCLHGEPRTDCAGASAGPYTGPIPMVTHVHGAHVGPGSDGYPEAWMLPNADNIDCVNLPSWDPDTDPDLTDNFACNGTFFESAEGADTANALGQGYSIKQYTNDQPTATLWYHDHSLGITRLNVYAAGAGFWLIRDKNEKETGLLSGKLPGPAPRVGDNPNCINPKGFGKGKKSADGLKCVRQRIREIPIAIQPKSFNTDGTQYYPADRAFFEGLGTGQTYGDNTDVNIPFLPQSASDISPVWNPEAFFNTMVVNGNTWPQLEVAQERYRLRFVNASDSRFMNLSLKVVNADGSLGQEIPFYQIGSDQGLLPAVVRIETGFATTLPGDGSDVGSGVTRVPGTFAEQALLLGPAERPDVIVDFSGLADGTVLRMINTAPDAPFGGFPDVPADPATTGQVMQFRVNLALNNPDGDPSTPAPALVLDTNPGGVAKLGASSVTRDLALLEEESAQICAKMDVTTGAITQVADSVPPDCAGGGEPFGPKAAVLGVNGSDGGTVQLWDDPISTNPQLGAIETWELWNWSADAHPIHLHLVKFEVVDRQIIGGAVRAPEPWEAGWKDTVIAYPGEVTRVKALFDVPGLYVWHCHILSHEDNEMMVPYCVGTPGVDCPEELFPEELF
jgi:FtsP/CotA-like multicopper oxidase with cupredoxin domain